MTEQPPRSFVPSESVPWFGVVSTLGVVTLGVTPLAAAYALATFYWPIANFVLLLSAPALGVGAVAIGEWGLRVGRIRSPMVGWALVVFAGLFAWYVSWVVWIAVLGGDVVLLQLAVRPLALARVIAELNQVGPREFGDWQPTGLPLTLIWLIEGALIVGVAAFMGRSTAQELYVRPFCEHCRSWLGNTNTIACLELGDDDPERLRAAIRVGDWSPLRERGPSDDEDNAVQIVVGSCTCGALNILAVERHTASDRGYDREVLGKDLLVDEALVREFGRVDSFAS